MLGECEQYRQVTFAHQTQPASQQAVSGTAIPFAPPIASWPAFLPLDAPLNGVFAGNDTEPAILVNDRAVVVRRLGNRGAPIHDVALRDRRNRRRVALVSAANRIWCGYELRLDAVLWMLYLGRYRIALKQLRAYRPGPHCPAVPGLPYEMSLKHLTLLRSLRRDAWLSASHQPRTSRTRRSGRLCRRGGRHQCSANC